MTALLSRLLLLAALTLPAAYGQFELYLVDGNVERSLPPVYDLGSLYPGESLSLKFRLRNVSAAPAALSVLGIGGSGFSISGAPPLPVGLASQEALEFRVLFQPSAIAAYSAALYSEGISVILTATVQPRLTPLVEDAAGFQTLGSTPVNFGGVELGSSVVRSFVLENRTAQVLFVPAISVEGGAYHLLGAAPSGTILSPRQSVRFDVQFDPPGAGTFTGALLIGDRSYPFTGTGSAIPLPKPSLDLSEPGTARIVFDAPARTDGEGTISLELQPLAAGATDPEIRFAAGARTASFHFSAGNTEATVSYRSGTTAGTVVFSVQLGNATARESLVIAPAAVTITSAAGTRSAGSVELRIEAIDNTRSVGKIAYTFYDGTGNPIQPGTLTVDSSADFVKYFQGSDAGGKFLLRSIFPITGDVSGIATFEVEVANSAGTVKTGRISF